MRSIIGSLLTAVLLALAPTGAGAAEKPKALRIGAVAYSPNSVTIFRAIRHYFAKNAMPVEFALYSTYDELGNALKQGDVDVAWNSPQGHARFHLDAGGSQVLVMRDVDVDYRVLLLARKDAGISDLNDLAGKSMIFGSCDSADSTVLPVYFLRKEAVDFGRVKIVSLHDEVDEIGCPCHSQHHVMAALLKGRGQAGVVGPELWKKLQADKPDEAAKLKVVWTSPPFSHCIFTARKDFPKETADRFNKLMLAMDGKDTLTAEILRLEHCAKWVPAGQKAQDGYADLLKALRERSTLPVSLRK